MRFEARELGRFPRRHQGQAEECEACPTELSPRAFEGGAGDCASGAPRCVRPCECRAGRLDRVALWARVGARPDLDLRARPVDSPSRPCDDAHMSRKRILQVLLAAAGIVLGVLAYQVQIDSLGRFTTPGRSLAIVAVGWSFLLAGLIAWSRRSGNRLGPLMIAAGLALLFAPAPVQPRPVPLHGLLRARATSGTRSSRHSVLAYPSGSIADRYERALVKVGYATVLRVPARSAALRRRSTTPRRIPDTAREPRLDRRRHRDRRSAPEGIRRRLLRRLGDGVHRPYRSQARSRDAEGAADARAPSAGRDRDRSACGLRVRVHVRRPPARLRVPLLVADPRLHRAADRAPRGPPPCAARPGARRRSRRPSRADHRRRHSRRARRRPRRPDARARALASRAARVRGRRRDVVHRAGGRPDPGGDAGSSTRVEPLAVLVHDPVAAGGAKARRGGRGRRAHGARERAAPRRGARAARDGQGVAGTDRRLPPTSERRRIERDLHDGAQQRLVALALELRSAQRGSARNADPELDRLLASTADELQVAVEELRELAHGIHPGDPHAGRALAARSRRLLRECRFP